MEKGERKKGEGVLNKKAEEPKNAKCQTASFRRAKEDAVSCVYLFTSFEFW